MKRASPKKVTERRKRPRGKGTAERTQVREARPEECCHYCSQDLRKSERALFVEEEIGRIFCDEECIASYFSPEIERLEKEYHRKLSSSDLSSEEREYFSHLRWITLKEPDEVWREKTLTGDYRYTLISQFHPGQKTLWCVCICLFLREEPSFLYLAFPTKNSAMVNTYRKGEQIDWKSQRQKVSSRPVGRGAARSKKQNEEQNEEEEGDQGEASSSDRLADSWTMDETFRAQLSAERSKDDIPAEEFGNYQACIEETLETPDEVWSFVMGAESSAPRLYHFIRHYPDGAPAIWYIIIARAVEEEEEQIEILDAFPTRDLQLVEQYRRGEQEVGQSDASRPVGRVVH